MDYHSLKRRELQALCKKHNIPANSANSVLADKLSALLNEKQKPKGRQRTCMKSSVESSDDGEPAALKRQAKKVRFSPTNDMVEYELRSGEKQKDMVTQTKDWRKSVANKSDKPVVDDITATELVDSAQIPVKVTRSRMQLSGKDVVNPNNEKTQTRRRAKSVEKGTDVDKETEGGVGKVTRSKAYTLQKDDGVQREENKQSKRLVKKVEKTTETVQETVVGRVRVTRAKAQTLTEGGTGRNANPLVIKKTRKQVKTEGQSVEPSKEIMDIPARATRSTRQTIKEDIVNTVTNLQADKKRTRREMKATDLSGNSSHVTPVEKQEPPKRKSLRTVEIVDEDTGDKMEAVNVSRVTRSKAPMALEASGRNSRNKANKVEIQQLEEPLKHAGKKNVNRRKSVFQPGKTEVDPHLEEPVNHPARRNTRRKSVMQKTTDIVESSTVGKKENVTRSGKDASEIKFEEVTTGTPKSRKRRGTPTITEDQIIEPEYGSPVDKSAKSSTRSAIKSEVKSVAKKQVESSVKKPMSRMNNNSYVDNACLEGKSSAIRSGTIIRDSSSKKRAKLSGTKQSDSEDHPVNSSKEGTPVAKTRNFKLDEVTEPEVTPAIDNTDRRFTRSTIRNERKEPSQSAIKEQPVADAQLFSPKVAKFRPDPAVNTAPGRVTRRGVKHSGNAAGSFSEKVVKKKQTHPSAHKTLLGDAQIASPKVAGVGPDIDVSTARVQSAIKQPLDEVQTSSPEDAEGVPNQGVDTIGVRSEIKQLHDDVQMHSPEVTEVQPNPDNDTVVVSEISKEVTGQILGDLSASESARLPTKVVEENRVGVSGTAIDLESASLVTGENASVELMGDAGVTPHLTEKLLSGKQQNPPELQSFDAGTPLGKNPSHVKMTSVSMADVTETVSDAVSDVSHVQNQNDEVYVESGVFEAVNLETQVLKSGSVDAREKETGSTEPGSTSKGMQTDVMIEEPLVSVVKEVEMESDPVSYDVGSSAVCHSSIQQSDFKHDVADDGEQYDGVSASTQKPLMPEPDSDSEDRGVADGVDVRDDGVNVPKELETSSELSNVNKTLEVPVSGTDIDIECVLEDNSDVQDGESEHDQFASNDNHATDEEDVGVDDSEPAQNENMSLAAEVLVRYCDQEPEQSLVVTVDDVPCDTVGQSDSIKTIATSGIDDVAVRVDAPEESAVDIKKDVVSSVLGDIYDMDAEGDGGNEQKAEFDEGFQPNESGCIFSDLSDEQTKEKDETSRGNDHTLDDQEQAAATDDDSDSRKFREDGSHIGVKEVDFELVGNIKAHEDPTREEASPILYTKEPTVHGVDSSQLIHESLITNESLPITYKKEESLVDDTDSDLLTIKEDDRNKQEETQNASIPVDCGEDYDFGMDEFEKPVSVNGSADMEGKDKKDDQDSDLQTSARISSFIEESSGLAAGLGNSARKLEKDSGNAAHKKSNQEADILKESANAADMTEVFNWSDSSLKQPFETPDVTRSSDVNYGHADAVGVTNKDPYSAQKPSTPATNQINHLKSPQEEATSFANKDQYLSLKTMFTTPGTTRTSQLNDSTVRVANFTFPDSRCNEDIGSSRAAGHDYNHRWENDQSKGFDGNAVRGPENEIPGVPSFEDYNFNKLFENEEVGGSIDSSAGNTHFEFKQYELLNEAAGTSHHDPSGLKDNLTHSRGFENKEDNLLKGCITGHAGNTQYPNK